jgi:transposase
VLAFAAFGGVPRVLLYDNLKSAVIERVDHPSGCAIRFNTDLLAFAGAHRYEPRPVAVARGNEKGQVERSIRYIRDNFFAARIFTDLGDLNAQAQDWCEDPASCRPWPEDSRLTVRQAFAKPQRGSAICPSNTGSRIPGRRAQRNSVPLTIPSN